MLHTIAALAALGTSAVQGRFHRADVYMPVTPMFHVHAWGVPYMATVMGVKQVYPGRYAPDVLLDLIEREGVTFSHCVPTILHMLLGAADASAELWEGGYLHTEDIGTIDEQGHLQITDRIKDVIKSGGEWVSLLAIESIISSHEAVSEVAVIGVADERWGERPVALVVAKEGRELTPEEVTAHVKQHADTGDISRYAVPDRIALVDTLDKTSVGKINKKGLREKYGDS